MAGRNDGPLPQSPAITSESRSNYWLASSAGQMEPAQTNTVNVSPSRTTNAQTCQPAGKTIRIRKQGASEFVAARRWPGRPALSLRRSSFEVRTIAGAWSQGQRRVTAPLCRDHHQQRHREGNAIASWSNLRIKADDGGEGIMRRDMHRAKVISSRLGRPNAWFRRWNVHSKSVNGAPQAAGSQFLRYLK